MCNNYRVGMLAGTFRASTVSFIFLIIILLFIITKY